LRPLSWPNPARKIYPLATCAGNRLRLKVAGKPPETLEDEDLLGLANAVVIKITIVDGHVANFWKQVFPNQWADERSVTSGF
jgi:hypothetical protein